jgi:hypothetical protein
VARLPRQCRHCIHAAPLAAGKIPRGELRVILSGTICPLARWAGQRRGCGTETPGDVIVGALAQCQVKLNQGGYLSAYPTEFYDRLQKREVYVWRPSYTMHKRWPGCTNAHPGREHQRWMC